MSKESGRSLEHSAYTHHPRWPPCHHGCTRMQDKRRRSQSQSHPRSQTACSRTSLLASMSASTTSQISCCRTCASFTLQFDLTRLGWLKPFIIMLDDYQDRLPGESQSTTLILHSLTHITMSTASIQLSRCCHDLRELLLDDFTRIPHLSDRRFNRRFGWHVPHFSLKLLHHYTRCTATTAHWRYSRASQGTQTWNGQKVSSFSDLLLLLDDIRPHTSNYTAIWFNLSWFSAILVIHPSLTDVFWVIG